MAGRPWEEGVLELNVRKAGMSDAVFWPGVDCINAYKFRFKGGRRKSKGGANSQLHARTALVSSALRVYGNRTV